MMMKQLFIVLALFMQFSTYSEDRGIYTENCIGVLTNIELAIPVFDKSLLNPSSEHLLGKKHFWSRGKTPLPQNVTPDTWVTLKHVNGIEGFNQVEMLWRDTYYTWVESPFLHVNVKNKQAIWISEKGTVFEGHPKYINEYYITTQFKYLRLDPGRSRKRGDRYDRFPNKDWFLLDKDGLEIAIIIRGREVHPFKVESNKINPNTPFVSLPDWYIEKAKKHYEEKYNLQLEIDEATGLLLPIEQYPKN